MKLLLTMAFGSLVSLTMADVAAKGADQVQAIEPEAAEILQGMSDYLGSLQRFTFRAENTIDSVTREGQKLQAGAHDALFTFSPPAEAQNIGFIPLRSGYDAGGAQ